MAILFGGAGGSSNTSVYQASIRPISSDYTNQAYPPLHGIISPQTPTPGAAGGVTLPWTQDWTTGTPSIPAELSFSRPGTAAYENAAGDLVVGATANTPRFEYKNGSLKGLLIEEQRTNSAYGTNNAGGWGGHSIVLPGGSIVAPDRATSQAQWAADTTTDTHYGYATINKDSISRTYVFSAYIRLHSVITRVYLQAENFGNSAIVIFDLAGGQVAVSPSTTGTGYTAGQAKIEALTGSNAGWYRCQLTFQTDTSSTGSFQARIGHDSGSGTGAASTTFTGTGTGGFYACFANVEEVTSLTSVATSYIENTGSQGTTVTRPADVLTSVDTGLLSAQAWAVEVGDCQASTPFTILGLDNAEGIGTDSSNHLITGQGALQTSGNTGTWTGNNRGGVAWDNTPRVSISLDGGTVVTASNSPSILTSTTITFGSGASGSGGYINGHLRSMGAYASLTDSQLQSVTTVGGSYTPASGSVGSSAGTNAAAAVGAWLQSGVGSSAGANTTTGVGAELQSGVGSSAGTNTTIGVGHWLQSGIGSSAGTNTATATGSWLQSGIGSSAGTNTTTATATWLQAGVGSAAGVNTASATGAKLQIGVGSATGANTASGVGQAIFNGVGSSAGSNTSSAVGQAAFNGVGSSAGSNTATATATWLQAGAGSAAGTNTSSATGANLQIGVGSAAGANTATGIGAELQSGVGSSAGANTVTGTGHWLQSGIGSSAGANTAAGVGAELQSGVGSSAGTDTATGTSHWLQSGVGNAQGDNTSSGYAPGVSNVGSSSGSNTATAVGHWLQAGSGSSAGTNVAAAIGAWLQSGVGSSVGTDTATGVGSTGAIVTGAGSAVGANIATAIGAWLQVATGTAIGGNVANAAAGGVAGLEADFSNDFAQDFSGYPGAEAGLGTGDFNNDFNSDFAVFHVGRIVSGTGTSVGGNIATAVSSTVVFIPPIYPPPPPIPVKVWHPAQEYHRVQAPRATRVYARGTELRRRPPQGMKRRYG